MDVLSEDVADLGQKMMKLTLALEEERSLQVRVEKDLYKGFVIKQHDFGFERAMRQVEYFCQVPVSDDKFDNMKGFYQGQLISVMDIPGKEEEDEKEGQGKNEAHNGTSKAVSDDIVFSN